MKKTSAALPMNGNNSVNLTLIGMSGAGKSYWSKKMEEKGYYCFNCDEMIADRLGPRLTRKGKTTLSLANWMGLPFSKQYIKAEKLYLELEEAVIVTICDELEQSNGKKMPVVVDTTGSLIYLKKKLLNRLRNLTKMVYLRLPEEKHVQLFENFINDPKPVIWEGKFKPRNGEAPENALKRCYKNLLSFRNERYSLLADVVLDYSFHHNPYREVYELLNIMDSNIK